MFAGLGFGALCCLDCFWWVCLDLLVSSLVFVMNGFAFVYLGVGLVFGVVDLSLVLVGCDFRVALPVGFVFVICWVCLFGVDVWLLLWVVCCLV